jgi:hypothetical protein
MKKRPIIICLVVLILGSVTFWLQSNYIITGWLNGEAFYQGRPTSYWRRELGKIHTAWQLAGPVQYIFFREPTKSRKFLEAAFDNDADVECINDHVLLMGDPAAQGVLKELIQDTSVRIFASAGLARIESKK